MWLGAPLVCYHAHPQTKKKVYQELALYSYHSFAKSTLSCNQDSNLIIISPFSSGKLLYHQEHLLFASLQFSNSSI